MDATGNVDKPPTAYRRQECHGFFFSPIFWRDHIVQFSLPSHPIHTKAVGQEVTYSSTTGVATTSFHVSHEGKWRKSKTDKTQVKPLPYFQSSYRNPSEHQFPWEKIHHRCNITRGEKKGGGGIKKKGKKKDLRGLCRGVWGLFYSPLPAQELYKLHRKRKALPSQDAAVVAAGTLMSSTCPSDPVAFVEHWAHLKHWENRVLIPWALHRKETLQAPDDRRQTDRDEIHKQHAIQYHAFPMSFLESVFIHSPHLFLEVPPGNHLIWIQTQHSESKRKTY